jgi:hypothetical protein
MEQYKTARGNSLIYILLIGIIAQVFMGGLVSLVKSYVLLILIKIGWVGLAVYFLYYLLLDISLAYEVDNQYITVKCFWGLKRIPIAFEDIEGYKISEGRIKGVNLSGIGSERFSFGRNIIKGVGITRMFVTSGKKIVYLKTANIAYALSPKNLQGMKEILDDKKIKDSIEEISINKSVHLYKERSFLILFVVATAIIVILTLNPFILYLNKLLPAKMPLNFNPAFEPILVGTGKQFAFKQMTYGVLNMIILLCMYYASFFCAKYDKKLAYRYIYVALITSLTFLILQIRILTTFS